MRKITINFGPIILATLLVFIVTNCKRPLREASVKFSAKDKVAPFPFTSPVCTPTADYVVGKKNGSSYFTLYYGVNESSPTVDSRSFELRYPFGGNEYFYVNFVYLRKQKSANYELMSRKTPQVDRTYNKAEVYGQIGAAMVDSDKGGYVNVEYLPSMAKYRITLCDVPMSYTPNSTGIPANITVSLQFISE